MLIVMAVEVASYVGLPVLIAKIPSVTMLGALLSVPLSCPGLPTVAVVEVVEARVAAVAAKPVIWQVAITREVPALLAKVLLVLAIEAMLTVPL